MTETIRVETDARGVARLVLARTEKHNALSAQMMDEITAAITALGADPAVRVVVLAAEGGSFCAGGDLKWMQAQINADAETRAAGARKLAGMLNALDSCPKPVIGRVHGNAFGGGIGMMSVCDVAVGVEGARFGLTETKLGLTPATISPYVVARMGAAKARRVFMSSRLFDAAEARDLNLLARVVAPDDLDAAIEAEVVPYLSCAPGAVADAKALVRSLGPRIESDIVDATIRALVARWESPEAIEGITAFFDKRAPGWIG
ncbi:crotonase/enoyl-CoA hydratase family protein [Paenirhodobacter sp. CAU 1674]|uniref:crotonase/enoyl-CoA hydratase family protein n=1 Tax=Paenirhodobacter sp. CAU 1674 TaxID=3032596 RepID=UPI0023DC9E48|nr:crotonase/enoyl-CoA hydratase family protein [Paenirhodobacter sp. CAU 1674]MDF2140045.1 crotonase/enoyl-CoA hydratase family protein [Paenirhodobacter sp. CAU 1674]